MYQLKVIEKKDQRVLTSEQIAESFGTTLAKIRYNFSYNKKRYEEGKHYFVLKGEELKDFKSEFEIQTQLKQVHTLYLWTEKGAFLHAKSLSTDQAWNAYSQLVDDYFKVQVQKQTAIPGYGDLSPQLQFMIQMEHKHKELEAKQRNIEEQTQRLEHRINNFDKIDISGDAQQQFNKMIRKFAVDKGIHFQTAYREFKGFYNMAYRTNITSCHENYMLKKGKKMTLPQYLSETGHIEDAIRVADKMLNNEAVV